MKLINKVYLKWHGGVVTWGMWRTLKFNKKKKKEEKKKSML